MFQFLINRVIDLESLERLAKTQRNLNKVIKKHRRKLIRVKLYLNWETKLENKRVKLFITRLISLRLFGSKTRVENLLISLNKLTYLIDTLEASIKDYLELIRTV